MNFDQEKTQAPPPFDEIRAKERAELNYLRERQNGADAPMQTESAGRPYSDSEIVAELFKYHPPTKEQLPRYNAINQAAKNLAEVILANCPAGQDRSIAINQLRMIRMVANAAISLNGLSL